MVELALSKATSQLSAKVLAPEEQDVSDVHLLHELVLTHPVELYTHTY